VQRVRLPVAEEKEMPLKQKYLRHLYVFAIIFSLFQRSREPEETLDEASQLNDEEPGLKSIRCPQCRWQPNASSRWVCAECGPPEYFYNACGTCWNTFTTRGLCPGCGHQWRWTLCLMCWQWSLHEDWYSKSK
jgi:hypothetical protein